MPLIPNALERFLLLRLARQPGILIDYFATLGFRAAVVGVRLGVFDALGQGAASADQLASRLGTDVRGTTALLDALAALGYVKKRKGRFENAAEASRWLVRRSDPDFVRAVTFLESAAFDVWSDLEHAIRTGAPRRPVYEWFESDARRSEAFQSWTRWIARRAAPEIVSRASLPASASRLIDVGGGHGWYAAEFVRRQPSLHAVIFDLPTALESARDLLDDDSISARLTLQAGDFVTDDLGRDYDAALLLNIVHGLTPDDNGALMRRVAAALRPGGIIVVGEQFSGWAPGPAASAIQRLLGLNYYLALGGRTYSFDEAAAWLGDAGFEPPRRVRLRSLPGTSLAIARRRASAVAGA